MPPNIIRFSRNRCTSVEPIDEYTLRSTRRLQDTLTDACVEIRVRLPDLEIASARAEFLRSTQEECLQTGKILDKVVGVRIGAGMLKIIQGLIGERTACRQLAFMVEECCHCTKEASRILQWERAKAENPGLKFMEFRQERAPDMRAPQSNHTPQVEEAPRRPVASARKTLRDASSAGMMIDLHVHTHPASPCNSTPVDSMIEEAKRIGLSGICLTDHNHVWDPARVEALRQRHGFLILRGNDITTNQGDILVFGLDKDIQGIIDLKDLRRDVEQAGGFMIVAHPFRGFLVVGIDQVGLTAEKAMERPLFRYVDAVEVLNGKVTEKENDFALRVTEGLGLPATGGSDAHEAAEVGVYATEFYGTIQDEKDLIAALESGDFRPVVFQTDRRIGARTSQV